MIDRFAQLLFISLFAVAAFGADWQTGTYQYDGSGNVKAIGTTEQFRYDALMRLKAVTGSDRAQTFTYDRYGNLLTVTTGPETIRLGVAEATNRLTDGTANVFGTYDDAGRLIAELDGAGNTFQYDAVDAVVRAVVDGVPVVHLYGADGERVASVTVSAGTEGSSEWTFRNEHDAVIRRFSKNGGQWTWTEDYVLHDGRAVAAETNAPERTLHFFADHLGSPRLITGNGGAEVERRLYTAFGNDAGAPAPSAEKTGFTGHESDSRSLHYMHARYYNQDWGRFLSIDPVSTASRHLHTPQGWNRYSYARNNPLLRLDPDGAVDITFISWSVRVVMVAHSFLAGYSDSIPRVLPAGRSTASSELAYAAGRSSGNFVATHDIVVDASITLDPGIGNDLTAGVAVVNANDVYVFVGGGYSISMAPVSGTISIGLVENYTGTGSYSGLATSVSGPQPVGLTFSGNPLNPNGTVAMTLSVSTDAGLATQNVTYSVPVTQLSEELRKRLADGNGGYILIQGQLYRVMRR